jgi:hypothetical protein
LHAAEAIAVLPHGHQLQSISLAGSVAELYTLDSFERMTEIEGSWFVESSGTPLVRLKTILSPDRRFLAVVSSTPDSSFRVHIFSRISDPQFVGTFWSDVGGQSITADLETAERLAYDRLQTAAT